MLNEHGFFNFQLKKLCFANTFLQNKNPFGYSLFCFAWGPREQQRNIQTVELVKKTLLNIGAINIGFKAFGFVLWEI